LDLSADQFLNGPGKWLTDISTIGQDTLNGLYIISAATESKQFPFAICHLSLRDGDRVR
jgi:hypothetical protein